ncbi:MAG: O-antigen ligase family protein [Thermodesulfobacteriota bacterium]
MNKTKWDDKVEAFLYWNICATFFFLPISTSLLEISSGLMLAVWIFSGNFIRSRGRWWHEAWVKPVLLFMLLPIVALLWTDDLVRGVDLASKSYYWLLSFVVASVSFTRFPYKRIVDAFLLGLSITSLVVLLQLVGVIPIKAGRAVAFMGPITLSLLFVLGIVLLSFYFTKSHSRREKVVFTVVMLSYLIGLAVSGGRIGYLVCILLTPLILHNILGRRYILGLVAAAVLGAVIVASVPIVRQRVVEVQKNSVAYFSSGQKNSSVGFRFQMWSGALQMLRDNPILGVGTGGFNSAIQKYSDEPRLRMFDQPHNSYLYVASSFGLVGIVSFGWLIVVFFRKGWPCRHTIGGYSLVAFALVLFLGSLTDSQILSLATAKLFALFMGARVE